MHIGSFCLTFRAKLSKLADSTTAVLCEQARECQVRQSPSGGIQVPDFVHSELSHSQITSLAGVQTGLSEQILQFKPWMVSQHKDYNLDIPLRGFSLVDMLVSQQNRKRCWICSRAAHNLRSIWDAFLLPWDKICCMHTHQYPQAQTKSWQNDPYSSNLAKTDLLFSSVQTLHSKTSNHRLHNTDLGYVLYLNPQVLHVTAWFISGWMQRRMQRRLNAEKNVQ